MTHEYQVSNRLQTFLIPEDYYLLGCIPCILVDSTDNLKECTASIFRVKRVNEGRNWHEGAASRFFAWLSLQPTRWEAVPSSAVFVDLCQVTLYYIPEDSYYCLHFV
jgi:hypothetical protein